MKQLTGALLILLLLLSSCFRNDHRKPEITLLGPDKLNYHFGVEYRDPGYSAEDDRDGDITRYVKVSGEVNENVAGIYFLEFDVTDASGNEAQKKTRLVYIIHNSNSLSNIYYSTNSCSSTQSEYFTAIEPGSSGELVFKNLLNSTDSLEIVASLSGNLNETIVFPEQGWGDTLIYGSGIINSTETQIDVTIVKKFNSINDTCYIKLSP